MLSFRLWTIFYVFALFASAMATFNAAGVAVAVVVFAFWAIVYSSPQPQRRFLVMMAMICVLLFIMAVLLLPAVQSSRPSSRRGHCMNNLKQQALAVRMYADRHGSFPTPYITGKKNEPMLSWRVTILPLMEYQSVYDAIDRSKPWDDPRNRAPTSTMLDIFECPTHQMPTATTDYLAVIGPQTVWPQAGGRTVQDIRDGDANTIMLVETHSKNVNWAEPRDLTFDEAVDLLSRPVASDDGHEINNGFFHKSGRGRLVAFADGRIGFISVPLDRKFAAALLTCAGGESIDFQAIEAALKPELDYAKCYGFAVFVVLAIAPALGLWSRGPRGSSGVSLNHALGT